MNEEASRGPERLTRKSPQIRIESDMLCRNLCASQILRDRLEQPNHCGILPPDMIEQICLLSHSAPPVSKPSRVPHKHIS